MSPYLRMISELFVTKATGLLTPKVSFGVILQDSP